MGWGGMYIIMYIDYFVMEMNLYPWQGCIVSLWWFDTHVQYNAGHRINDNERSRAPKSHERRSRNPLALKTLAEM